MFSNPRAILDVFGINVGMTVADFGAGDGVYAKELVKRVGSDGVVYAFDVQKAYIERLAAYARDAKAHVLKPQWVDLELAGGTQLAPASLDAALVANIFFQIENKEIFMAEVARVLRPNGRVLIVDWSESFNNLGPHADQVVALDDVKGYARGAGLMFERDIPAGEHHYGLVFRK